VVEVPTGELDVSALRIGQEARQAMTERRFISTKVQRIVNRLRGDKVPDANPNICDLVPCKKCGAPIRFMCAEDLCFERLSAWSIFLALKKGEIGFFSKKNEKNK
jgi:hypothetical protein